MCNVKLFINIIYIYIANPMDVAKPLYFVLADINTNTHLHSLRLSTENIKYVSVPRRIQILFYF